MDRWGCNMIKIMIEAKRLQKTATDIGTLTGWYGTDTSYGVLIQVESFDDARTVIRHWTNYVTDTYPMLSVSASYIEASNTFELNII